MSRTEIERAIEAILAERRFQGFEPGRLDPVFTRFAEYLGRFFEWLFFRAGGAFGDGSGFVLVLVALVGGSILVSMVLSRRSSTIFEDRLALDRLLDEGFDIRELERLTTEAERDGDFTTAVRARFLVGIATLDRNGTITYRKGLTTGEIADLVDSPLFETIARRFDAITYGRSTATAEDAASAREGWNMLLDGVTT